MKRFLVVANASRLIPSVLIVIGLFTHSSNSDAEIYGVTKLKKTTPSQVSQEIAARAAVRGQFDRFNNSPHGQPGYFPFRSGTNLPEVSDQGPRSGSISKRIPQPSFAPDTASEPACDEIRDTNPDLLGRLNVGLSDLLFDRSFVKRVGLTSREIARTLLEFGYIYEEELPVAPAIIMRIVKSGKCKVARINSNAVIGRGPEFFIEP